VRISSTTCGTTRIGDTVTNAEQRQAAEVLRRVVERIDQGEIAAPGWLRERLVGAMLVLDLGPVRRE
jgi:hypothetical protein